MRFLHIFLVVVLQDDDDHSISSADREASWCAKTYTYQHQQISNNLHWQFSSFRNNILLRVNTVVRFTMLPNSSSVRLVCWNCFLWLICMIWGIMRQQKHWCYLFVCLFFLLPPSWRFGGHLRFCAWKHQFYHLLLGVHVILSKYMVLNLEIHKKK